MSWPAVSGIAVDTPLFSRIGVPLFHHYRVVNRLETHGAFRGAKMRRMHAFLGRVGCGVVTSASLSMHSGYCSTDVADIYFRQRHGRQDARFFFSTKSHSSVGLQGRRPIRPVAVAGSLMATGAVRPHRSEVNTIPALMDLTLPRFEGLGDGPQKCIGHGWCRLSRRIRVV